MRRRLKLGCMVTHNPKLNDERLSRDHGDPVTLRHGNLQDSYVMAGDEDISLSKVTRNLGVTLDQHLNKQNHVKQVGGSTSCAHLRNIAQIRGVLPQETQKPMQAGPCPEVDLAGWGPAWRSHAQLGDSGRMFPREPLNIYIEIILFGAF